MESDASDHASLPLQGVLLSLGPLSSSPQSRRPERHPAPILPLLQAPSSPPSFLSSRSGLTSCRPSASPCSVLLGLPLRGPSCSKPASPRSGFCPQPFPREPWPSWRTWPLAHCQALCQLRTLYVVVQLLRPMLEWQPPEGRDLVLCITTQRWPGCRCSTRGRCLRRPHPTLWAIAAAPSLVLLPPGDPFQLPLPMGLQRPSWSLDTSVF